MVCAALLAAVGLCPAVKAPRKTQSSPKDDLTALVPSVGRALTPQVLRLAAETGGFALKAGSAGLVDYPDRSTW